MIPQTSPNPTLKLENAVDTLLMVAALRGERKSKILTTSGLGFLHFFPLSDEFAAYEKFARWQAHSNNPFIDYFTVLDIGVQWEKLAYGKLSSSK